MRQHRSNRSWSTRLLRSRLSVTNTARMYPMSDAVKGRRTYDSTRWRQHARQTQLDVLHTAHHLFVARGYGRTTMADIAEAAGVSVDTVYGAFGTKVALLHRVWDITIGGDDEDVVFHERPEIRALRAEPHLATRLRGHAAM